MQLKKTLCYLIIINNQPYSTKRKLRKDEEDPEKIKLSVQVYQRKWLQGNWQLSAKVLLNKHLMWVGMKIIKVRKSLKKLKYQNKKLWKK